MNLLSEPGSPSPRRLLLLAPQGADTSGFADVRCDRDAYDELLAEVQRFRAQVRVEERRLDLSDLTADGRHVQAADYRGWHLLSLNGRGRIESCARVLLYDSDVNFSQLTVSESALAQCDRWGWTVRRAIEGQIEHAT